MSRITLDELSAKVSASVRTLNPEVFGGNPVAPIQESVKKRARRRTIEETLAAQEGAKRSLEQRSSVKPVVTIIGFRVRTLDDDNFSGGLKALRDSIAAFLGLDDHHSQIKWRYYQVEVEHKHEEGTCVKIER